MLFRTKMRILLITLSLVPIIFLGGFMSAFFTVQFTRNSIEAAVAAVRGSIHNLDLFIDEIDAMALEIAACPEMHDYLMYQAQSTSKIEIEEEELALYERLAVRLRSAKAFKPGAILDAYVVPIANPKLPTVCPETSVAGKFFLQKYLHSDIYSRALDLRGQLLWEMESFPTSPYRTQRYDYKNSILVSCAIINISKRDVVGMLCLQIDRQYLSNFFATMHEVEELESILLTDSDIVLLHADPSMVGEPYDQAALLEIAKGSPDAGEARVEMNGLQYRLVYGHADKTGWISMALLPENTGYLRVMPMIQFALLVVAAMAVVTVLASLLLSHSISRPIAYLSNAMSQVDHDNLDVRVHMHRNDEFGTLADNLDALLVRVRRLIKQLKQEQRLKADAELTALRAQITPHFLYNTLNVIKCLAEDQDTESVALVTDSLSQLLRISIGNRNDTISLRDELKILKSYERIQRYRTDIRFLVHVDVAEELMDYQIKKFTLQPLVENSIIHGFKSPDGNMVSVRAWLSGDNLYICVEDNGKGFDETPAPVYYRSGDAFRFNGIGIGNVDERLKLHFGPEYGLTLKNHEPHGAAVLIRIPAWRIQAQREPAHAGIGNIEIEQ